MKLSILATMATLFFSLSVHAETVNYDCASFEPHLSCEVIKDKVANGTLSNAECLGILDYVQKAINRDVCCAGSDADSKRLNLDDGPNPPPVPPAEDDSIENNACEFLNPINGGSQFSIDVDKDAHCTGIACDLDCSSRSFSKLDEYKEVAICNQVRQTVHQLLDQ